MKKEEVKNKDIRYEALRVFACMLVVLSHVAEQGQAFYSVPGVRFEMDDWMIYNIWNSFSRSGAPLFIMISGSFMLDPCKDVDLGKQIRKLLEKMIAWYIFYSLVYYLLYNAIFNPGAITIIDTLKASILLSSQLWFVWCLLSMYLITPFLRKIVVDKKLTYYYLTLSFITTFIISQIGSRSEIYNRTLNKMDYYFVYGMVFYYVAGYAVRSLIELIDNKTRYRLLGGAFVIFVITWGLAVYIAWKLNADQETYMFVKTVFNDGFITTGIETLALFILFSCIKITNSTFPADIFKQSLYKCRLRVHPFGYFTFDTSCDICRQSRKLLSKQSHKALKCIG